MTPGKPTVDSSRSGLAALGRPGRPTFGTWIKLPSLETVELIAAAGFDFVVIDLEHSPLTLESVYASTVVGQGLGLTVLVRVSDRSGSQVQRLLDSGVDGLLIPQVADAEVARQAVEWMRFPPHGTRGLGATSRAGLWGLRARADYLSHGETHVARCMQLESRGALEHADTILDTDGVNAVFLGAGDLTLSTGLSANDPKIGQWSRTLIAQANQRNIPCGTAVATAPDAREAAEAGFTFILVNNDAGIFAAAIRTLKHQIGHVSGPV